MKYLLLVVLFLLLINVVLAEDINASTSIYKDSVKIKDGKVSFKTDKIDVNITLTVKDKDVWKPEDKGVFINLSNNSVKFGAISDIKELSNYKYMINNLKNAEIKDNSILIYGDKFSCGISECINIQKIDFTDICSRQWQPFQVNVFNNGIMTDYRYSANCSFSYIVDGIELKFLSDDKIDPIIYNFSTNTVLNNIKCENSGTYCHMVVNSSIKTYFPIDANMTESIVSDWSQSNNHGSFSGTATASTTTGGIYGGALSFYGRTGAGYVNLPIAANPTEYTYSAWVKIRSNHSGLVAVRTSASGPTVVYSHELGWGAGTDLTVPFHYCYGSTSWASVGALTYMTTDVWYHLAGTAKDNGKVRIYVNGVLEGTSATNLVGIWASGTKYLLGSEAGVPANYVNYTDGLIDDFMYWDRELNESEIANIYNTTYRKYLSNASNLSVSTAILLEDNSTIKITTILANQPNTTMQVSVYNGTQWSEYQNISDRVSYPFDIPVSLTTLNLSYNYFSNLPYYFFSPILMGNINILVTSIAPAISFIFPTPDNNSAIPTLANASLEINASIIETKLNTLTYNWNGVNTTIYNDTLLFMMNFENRSDIGENSTKAVDVSRYANNGTIYGNATWNASGGRYGGAYMYDGINDFISLGTNSNMKALQVPMTISGWFNERMQYGGEIFSQYQDVVNHKLVKMIRVDSGGFRYFASKSDGTYQFFNIFTPTIGVWYYFSVVIDGTINNPTGVVYIYDTSQNLSVVTLSMSALSSTPNQGVPIDIGAGNDAWEFFNGTIDEVRVWNRALSANEVDQIYRSNLQKFNNSQWYLYVNQTRNKTSIFPMGRYKYSASSIDMIGNINNIETRDVVIGENIFPSINFTSPTPSNNTAILTLSNTSLEINVSIIDQNLKNVTYNWNGTSYSIYDDSLVLMMNFENLSSLGENSTRMVDVSRNGNIGTCTGISCPIWNSTGKYGGAYQFNKTKKITLPDSPSLRIPSKITISAWVKTPLHNSVSAIIVQKRDLVNPGVNYNYGFWVNGSGALGFQYYDTTYRTVYANGYLIPINQWTYITVVADEVADTLTFYHDGIVYYSVANTGTMPSAGNAVVEIGYYSYDTVYGFNGLIDEVRIWNRALTATEINQIYRSNLQKFNQTQWYFYTNQTKNATATLDNGTYTYQMSAIDYVGNMNWTEQRTVTVGAGSTSCVTGLSTGIFLCSDNCNLGTINLNSNNLQITGTGTFKGNITNYKNITVSGLCTAWIQY